MSTQGPPRVGAIMPDDPLYAPTSDPTSPPQAGAIVRGRRTKGQRGRRKPKEPIRWEGRPGRDVARVAAELAVEQWHANESRYRMACALHERDRRHALEAMIGAGMSTSGIARETGLTEATISKIRRGLYHTFTGPQVAALRVLEGGPCQMRLVTDPEERMVSRKTAEVLERLGFVRTFRKPKEPGREFRPWWVELTERGKGAVKNLDE